MFMPVSLLKGAHITERKFVELVTLFSEDLTAIQISNITQLSRITINNYLKRFRERIAWNCASTLGETAVINPWPATYRYGIIRNNQHFITVPVQEGAATTDYPAFLAIADFSTWKLLRLPELPLTKNRPVIDELSGFWGLSKNRLQKFRGLQKSSVYLHVKECEFRYNNRQVDLQALMIDLFLNS